MRCHCFTGLGTAGAEQAEVGRVSGHTAGLPQTHPETAAHGLDVTGHDYGPQTRPDIHSPLCERCVHNNA